MSRPDRDWRYADIATQLDANGQVVGFWLTGDKYPLLAFMRKIEKVLGWKTADQIMTLPVDGGRDMVYAETLRQYVDAWWEAQK